MKVHSAAATATAGCAGDLPRRAARATAAAAAAAALAAGRTVPPPAAAAAEELWRTAAEQGGWIFLSPEMTPNY